MISLALQILESWSLRYKLNRYSNSSSDIPSEIETLVYQIILIVENCQAILNLNKAGYMATDVACGWAGGIFGVTELFGQEQ